MSHFYLDNFYLAITDFMALCKAVTGVVDPKKLIIRFKDTKGDYHEHKFPGHAARKWDDDEWIKSLNKWRYQTVSRKFKRDGSISRGNRGRWTVVSASRLFQPFETTHDFVQASVSLILTFRVLTTPLT